MAMAGLDLRVRAIDADEVTAAIAAVSLRHRPDCTAAQGSSSSSPHPRARGAGSRRPARPRPPHAGVADITGRTRRVFRLDCDLPVLGARAGGGPGPAGDRGKLSPAFSPRRAAPRGRGAVDLL